MTNTNGARKVKQDMETLNAIEDGDPRPNIDEVLESINGFEEVAVEKAFGADPIELAQGQKLMKFTRAMVFVVKKREGLNDLQARQAAMEMTMADLQTFFVMSDDDDEDPKEETSSAKRTQKSRGGTEEQD